MTFDFCERLAYADRADATFLFFAGELDVLLQRTPDKAEARYL